MNQATALQNGFLTYTDFQTFNNKQNAITLTTTGTSGAATLVGATLNIPNYAPDLSGYVTLAGTQTITGAKTFSTFTKFDGGVILKNNVSASLAGYVGLSAYSASGNKGINIDFDTYSASFYFSGTLPYQYTFPAATGTIALVGGSGVGTVTSVAALTIGTSGTDLSSTVATSTTTPVITLNVPTASAANRGALSSADWTTFNNKYNLPSLTSGSVLFSNGTTIAQDNANFFWDDTNNRLGIGTNAPDSALQVIGTIRWDNLSSSNGGTAARYSSFTNTGQSSFFGVDSSVGGFTGVAYAAFIYTDSKPIVFAPSTVARVIIDTSGRTSIGYTTNPSTYMLDVNGTGRFSDRLNVFKAVSENIIIANYDVNNRMEMSANGFNLVGGNPFYIRQASGANQFSIHQTTGAATFSSSVSATNALLNTTETTGAKLDVASSLSKTSTTFARIASFRTNEALASYPLELSIAQRGATQNIELQAGHYGLDFSANIVLQRDGGYVLIGSSTVSGSSILQVTGAATFSSTCTATGFFESSDSRLKTLIQDNYQTKGIASITPKLYTKNGKVELGYYAQDFVGILDSAVSKGSDEMLSLSYREVHTAKIYALEQEIKELKAKMN
jgi:hypothetical protein